MNGFGFGYGDRFGREVWGPGGPLSGGDTPGSSAPPSGSSLSQAEQLAIVQTALDTGLKVFSAIFGAILAIDQKTGLATTQDGSQVPYDQLGEVSATDTTGQVVYVTDSSGSGAMSYVPWAIAGVAVVGVLLLGLRR